MKSIDDEQLFEVEREVLKAAASDLANPNYATNQLLPRYRGLAENYGKLLKVTRKIFSISDKQGQVLHRHQLQIQNLLDNANQGFMTFGLDLKVDQQYSAECTRIFGRKVAGVLVPDLLAQGDETFAGNLRQAFGDIFSNDAVKRMNGFKHFPSILRILEQDVRVECKLIKQLMGLTEATVVMMILTNITKQVRAEEKISFLSYHDKLTSLYNRAYIEEVLPKMERPEVFPVSVIMADMNALKLVNDVFGHQQGDLMLVEMAKVLQKVCRQTDSVVRWGGDEFVVLLPCTDAAACLKICGRIQTACEKVTCCAISLSAAIGMASKAGGNFCFAELLNIAENNMYNDKLIKSREVRRAIIADLEGRLVERCFENEGHGQRVYCMALVFIEFLGQNASTVDRALLQKLVQLHDIGKIAISPEILGSTSLLTFSEWEIIKSHSEIGYRMAQSIGEQDVADVILALHERWDGGGYPYGLKGEGIPFLARLFAIVDAYDVMTHSRAYKTVLTKAEALKEIETEAGRQFDPRMVGNFTAYMSR